MKTTRLRISALCAAGSMLAVAAQAQPSSPGSSSPGVINQNMPRVQQDLSAASNQIRSWSTKHLSATGRDSDYAVRASKLAGAPVRDSSGKPVGEVQDIILNPSTGRVDFALISPNTKTGANGSNEKLVPVPWDLLRTSASAQYSGGAGQLAFTLKADASKLSGAPAVDWSDLSQSEWRQRIYSYYGVTPPAMGGAESPSGEMKGGGSRDLHPVPPPQQ